MHGDESGDSLPETAILMDLISHDIQNNHQAVLSYMDLILSSADTDDKVKDYALKAALQIRTSSMLIDNVRRFVEVRQIDERKLSPVSLKESIEKVAQELSCMFRPGSLTLRIETVGADERVLGGGAVQDMLGNILLNIAQLDSEERVTIDISSEPTKDEGGLCSRITIRSPTAHLPPGVPDDFSIGSRHMDMSKTARLSGLFIGSRIARALGGDLRAGPADPSSGKGCVCEISLRRAEQR